MEPKKREELQLKFLSKKIDEEQKRFKTLESSESLLDFQYQCDNFSVMSFLNEWLKKAKTDKQKKILSDNIEALIRMSSYVSTMQTVSKLSVSKLLTEKEAYNNLFKKFSKLEKENSFLRNMIQEYEK